MMVSGHLQEKSGRYYAVISYKNENGKRVVKWVSTGLTVKGNKKKAEEFLMNLRMNTHAPNISQNTLFSDYMLQWLQSIKSSVAPSTFSGYKNIVENSVVPYFTDIGITLIEIRPSHIQNYYDSLFNRGANANTVLHHHANIRKALQDAFCRDLILNNPADKIKRPSLDTYVAQFYSADECNKLLKIVMGTKIELPVILALFYGFRRSEVLGVKWESVSFSNKTILINYSVVQTFVEGKYTLHASGKLKKKASYRTMPLLEPIEQVLMREISRRYGNSRPVPSDYICVDEKGALIKPDYLTRSFNALLKEHKMRRIRFHDIRHSCASLLIAERVPLIEVQQWLGHSNISVTADLYSHLVFDSKLQCGKVMEKK